MDPLGLLGRLWLSQARSRLLLDRVIAQVGDAETVLRVPELGVVTFQLPTDTSPLSIDGIRDDVHTPPLTCWNLEGGLQRVLVVKDATYSLRVHNPSDLIPLGALVRGGAGDTIRPRLAGGMRLRVHVEGKVIPAMWDVVARSGDKECALESIGRSQFDLDLPLDEYDVVVVQLSRNEIVLGRGLRPTGNWHHLNWP
ncbi:MAG: hypothetical protein AB7T63_11880 [Planctomycetota bacterium]